MPENRSARRRLTALAACVATAGAMFFAVSTPAAAKPLVPLPPLPANPTDQQLSAARALRDTVAQEVGQLSAQVAAGQQRLNQLSAQAELAQQRSAFAFTKWQQSKQTAAATNQKAADATKTVADARIRFAQYMQAVYMTGQPSGLTGALLTAKDPNALLDQSALDDYAAQNNVTAIGQLQVASVTKANLDAAARLDEKAQEQNRRIADATKQVAQNALADQKAQQQVLQAQVATTQGQLQERQLFLATVNGQRAKYEFAIQEQNKIIAQNVLIAQENELARQRAIALQAAQQAAERARRRAAQQKNSGSSDSGGGGGGGGSSYLPPTSNLPAPTGGSWTAAKARQAVDRVKSTLGTPYAWAGGGAGGPSYGVCDAGNGAANDCNVYGYDCSGLVMFGWHQNWDHFAATQYSQAGSFHPSRDQLRPGDLLFWSGTGQAGDIHHVAMYVGGGQMIEAPYSGGVVQYNSIDAYSDYFGATRPLT